MKQQAACIRIYEYDSLRTGEVYAPDGMRWEQRHWERLAAYKQRTNCPYFEVLPQRLQFGSYVGLLQLEGLSIEILPKFDRGQSASELMQSILLQMLFFAEEGAGNLPLVDLAQGRGRQEAGRALPALLLLYWRLFAEELEGLLRAGLRRAYTRVEGRRSSLRGRLLLPKMLRQTGAQGHYFYTESNEYDENHACNRLLYGVLERLGSWLRWSKEGGRWARLLQGFSGAVSMERIGEADFLPYIESVADRQLLPYRRALRLGRLLLRAAEPTLSGGQWEGIALMYDMNKLWEQYLSRSLQLAAAAGELRRQAGAAFWREAGAGGWQYLRPDLVWGWGKSAIVFDCKWKGQSTAADWRQLYVYAHYFGAQKAFLLLPAPAAQREAVHTQRIEFAPTGAAGLAPIEGAILWVKAIDEAGRLHTRIGQEILSAAQKVKSEK